MLVTISYRRHLTSHLSPKKLAIASSVILLIIWSGYSVIRFSETYRFHEQRWASTELNASDWWQHYNPKVPTLRHNRFGHPAEPLNIQWQGSISSIQKTLEKQGWQHHSTHLDLPGFLERLSLQDPDHRLPLSSQLFHNRHPILLMTKLNDNNQYAAVIYLWQSDVQLLNSQTPLWVGSLKKYTATHKEIFTDTLSILLNDTRTLKTSLITLPKEKQDKIPATWEWDGKILQLK